MTFRHVLTTTPSQRGVPRRSRETAEAVMVKEKGVVVVVAGKALDLLPGQLQELTWFLAFWWFQRLWRIRKITVQKCLQKWKARRLP